MKSTWINQHYLKDKAILNYDNKNIFINIFQDEIDIFMLQDSNQIIPLIYMQQGFVFACKLHNYARWLYFICRSFRCCSNYVIAALNEKFFLKILSLEKQ